MPSDHEAGTADELGAARNIPALTGLRGVGALWVFLHHFNLFQYGTGKGVHALAVGFAGVDLFFLLSGFVLCHSRWDSFARPLHRTYRRFLLERAARLYPTNAAVLMLFALAAAAFPGVWAGRPPSDSSAASFLASLLLLQSWLPLPGGEWIGPGWSVSAEMGAYAALPALLLCLKRLPKGWGSFLLAWPVLGCFVIILTLAGVHDLNVSVRGGLLRLAFEFTAGGLLCAAIRGGVRLPVGITTAIIVLSLLAALTLRRAEANFLMLPAFALVLMLAARGEGLIVHALTRRPVMFLGRISYSLYLIHWPLLMFWSAASGLPRTPEGFAEDAAMVLCILGMATALHYGVEAPSHRWARRFADIRAGVQPAGQRLAAMVPGVPARG